MGLTGHSIKSFLVVECSGDKLPISIIDAHVETDEKGLIWSNNGLCGTLSAVTIGGILRQYRDTCKLPQLDRMEQVLYWDDVVPLDAKTAKLLFE
ncbi:hypothetical protein LCGC14_2328450 [marine sediment metagenome]|uniref:Uncharacterized protein n=1 Tax=marine sediment metagenome TaxID=412755 RepID=A0A0F9FAK5_9ZZZZ